MTNAKERQITYRPGEHHRSKGSRLVLRSQLQHAHKCILLQDEYLLHVSRFFEVLSRNAWRQTYGMSSVVP
jgi:ABC-type cobalamin transport system ATPase subunit